MDRPDPLEWSSVVPRAAYALRTYEVEYPHVSHPAPFLTIWSDRDAPWRFKHIIITEDNAGQREMVAGARSGGVNTADRYVNYI